jgi:microsomal dipeptidase-like Zn-dependent dipeptidase
LSLLNEKYLPREEYVRLPFEERLIRLSKNEDERANELNEGLISVDLHSLTFHPFSGDEREAKPYPRERARNSGLTCISETVDDFGHNPHHEFQIVVRDVWHYTDFFPKKQGMRIALCADDIRGAKREGEQSVLVSIEMDGSQVIGPSIMYKRGTPEEHYPFLDRIDILYRLGVRRFDAIANFRGYLGDGCLERSDSGLSHYGLAFVERMNEVGMMIDTSHWGERSTLDAIESSKAPVLISHAGARSLVPKNRRLKSDELIQALAEKGGLIGVCGIPNYLAQTRRQGVKDMIDHVDYIVDLVGVDHVGIGTDIVWGHHASLGVHRHYITHMGMEVAAEYMEGIESLEEWPNITRGLVSRGYSDREIEKIIGGNALRVMDEAIR